MAGAYAVFDGVGSPLTQTFGLGLFAEAGEAEFEALEAFFHQRGAKVNHEISPLGAPALLPHLSGRGYVPIEFTSVMFRPVTGVLPSAPAAKGRGPPAVVNEGAAARVPSRTRSAAAHV